MSDFWVFGYGSLMWRPGFEHLDALPARLIGAHRSLCVWSWHHRGTREKPGLVFGLDRGGACRGLAFRVRGRDRKATIAYLRERELISNVYRESWRPVTVIGGDSGPVVALTYLVDRSHEQYAGPLPPERLLEIVRVGEGTSGANVEYVRNTVRHLRQLGIRDPVLERLAGALGRFGVSGRERRHR